MNSIHRLLLIAALSGMAALASHAVSAEEPDTSPLTHSAVLRAPIAEVWDALTNPQRMRRWWAPNLEADIRVGGVIRSSYNPQSTLRDEYTIENTILAYAPGRMLSIRCTKAPADFPFKDVIGDTWSTILLDELGPDRTRVTFMGMGYTADEKSQRMRAFFASGNQYVIDQLKQMFEIKDVAQRDARVMELVGRFAKGEWVHQSARPDGATFRVRNAAHHGPDGVCIVSRGWLDVGAGPYEHAATLIHRLPASMGGGVEFTGIHENGAMARGPITLIDENTIEWHWPETLLDGRSGLYRIRTVFTDETHYTMLMFERQADGTEIQRLKIDFEMIAPQGPDPSLPGRRGGG